MGTNYFLKGEACPHCGQVAPPGDLHIGKSSAGWVFHLALHPEQGINDLWDWVARWEKPGAIIIDEYGKEIAPYDMLKRIVLRRSPRPVAQLPFGGEVATNNLCRLKADGRHCIGHGHASWSHMKEEFS